MNPYLLQMAKEHQAEIRREVETQHLLKDDNPQETPGIQRKTSPASVIYRTVNFLSGFLGNHGKTAR
jgi:hypothetical protein